MTARRLAAILSVGVLALAPAGCGKPAMRAVTGTVKLNGKPVESCKVGFFPDVTQFDPDRHGFGFGVTDKDGRFTVQHPQGEKGIYAGTYKVTFLLFLDAKGKVLPADTKPSEVAGGARNAFPDKYEFLDTTPERATVTAAGGDFRFDITK